MKGKRYIPENTSVHKLKQKKKTTEASTWTVYLQEGIIRAFTDNQYRIIDHLKYGPHLSVWRTRSELWILFFFKQSLPLPSCLIVHFVTQNIQILKKKHGVLLSFLFFKKPVLCFQLKGCDKVVCKVPGQTPTPSHRSNRTSCSGSWKNSQWKPKCIEWLWLNL